jgi:hypothetical protein
VIAPASSPLFLTGISDRSRDCGYGIADLGRVLRCRNGSGRTESVGAAPAAAAAREEAGGTGGRRCRASPSRRADHDRRTATAASGLRVVASRIGEMTTSVWIFRILEDVHWPREREGGKKKTLGSGLRRSAPPCPSV